MTTAAEEIRDVLERGGLEVDPQLVHEMQKADDRDLVLVDCRTAEERAMAAIPGSVHAPLEDLASRLPGLDDDVDRIIVVYCHTGRRSLSAVAAMRKIGIDNAVSMAGGIEKWSIQINPSIPRY